MQSVDGLKTQRTKFHRALCCRFIDTDRGPRSGGKQTDPLPSVVIRNLGDLEVNDLAAHQRPSFSVRTTENRQDGFCFKANPILATIVERSVEAADIEIDSHSDPGRRSHWRTRSISPVMALRIMIRRAALNIVRSTKVA